MSPGKVSGRVARGAGFVALRLDGIIDEHNELMRLSGPLGQGEALLIDLGGVRRLNSVGVRDWVNWLRALRERFKTVVLFDCPPPVMSEVNFVKNFAEGAHITSFAVPLFCTRCEKEETRLLETAPLLASRKLPAFGCVDEACANLLDDDEESYLSFIEGLPPGDPVELAALTSKAREALKAAVPLEAGPASAPASVVPNGAMSAPTTSAVAPAPEPARGRGDGLFMAAMAAMVAVLGVLVYLILTLE